MKYKGLIEFIELKLGFKLQPWQHSLMVELTTRLQKQKDMKRDAKG